jgi:uncharacterized YigZ family protein
MRTLAGPASLEATIKHSRFVAHAAAIDDLSATLDFYESVADPSATHNCWAWRLDYRYRFNDDGEPASSAGKPILAAIEGKGLENVMVVVTRYFGGIKLGVGGLIRAYGGTAARCLDQAGMVDVQTVALCEIESGFEWTAQVHAAISACDAEKLAETYTAEGARYRVEVAENQLERLAVILRDTTRGSARFRQVQAPESD